MCLLVIKHHAFNQQRDLLSKQAFKFKRSYLASTHVCKYFAAINDSFIFTSRFKPLFTFPLV